jgi:peptidyl-prolyl cis-trans isomerase C
MIKSSFFKSSLLSAALGVALMFSAVTAHAQAKAGAVMANVNGVAIPQSLLEHNVQVNVARGQRDTPELRQVIKEELITREALAQEAAKLGLDKTPEAQAQWAQLRQTFLVELLLSDYLKQNPITEAKIKAEFDRQVAAIKGQQEYKISLIVTPTEEQAKGLLVRLRKGESFSKLATETSIDASKAKGGDVGWVLPSQILPAISNVMVNLNKGTLAAAPIQTQAGWNIIRVEDKRTFQPPKLEDAKNDLRAALLQQQRAELVKKLRDAAKVQ